MLHVVLHQPEIPPNTGNVIRLCANTGARLHLIRPLAFSIDDARLKRAGLDYHEYTSLQVHDDFDAFIAAARPANVYALSTRGTRRHIDVAFGADDAIVFGSETRGLPQELIDGLPDGHCLRLPMRPHNRSLNLSNAVAVVVFEAWRQAGFEGAL
ncbi:MAG: tRNA (uridine(34)/cytosine(34)/5-carboxymethylaminomethyluridine(34)-2'-O)-methyltransferase TrmL [Tahibacter sp.]